MVVLAEQEPQTAGELIRFWRRGRGLSQLELSLDANVSTKHLSFVETGRSRPSRLDERSEWVTVGMEKGFAPGGPHEGERVAPIGPDGVESFRRAWSNATKAYNALTSLAEIPREDRLHESSPPVGGGHPRRDFSSVSCWTYGVKISGTTTSEMRVTPLAMMGSPE